MKIKYVHKKFQAERLAIITQADAFLRAYHAQGYVVTLRQLYYKFISTDTFPATWIDAEYNRRNGLAADTKNTIRNYKKLGEVVSAGRRAGLLDWALIEDRTRNLETHSFWDSPAAIVATCVSAFNLDFWGDQPYRPEVWIEKDALVGIIEPICREFQVPYFAARGYPSDSELHSAAQRLAAYAQDDNQIPVVIHLGDHDPSGKDMTRDIFDRLNLFASNLNPVHDIEVKRIALNWDQITQYNPPPNPAKATDARYKKYQEQFGDESWELDALEPDVLNQLIRDHLTPLIDPEIWAATKRDRDQGRDRLRRISNAWTAVVDWLEPALDEERPDEDAEDAEDAEDDTAT